MNEKICEKMNTVLKIEIEYDFTGLFFELKVREIWVFVHCDT